MYTLQLSFPRLYEIPQGLDSLGGEAVEIEIVDPESVSIDMDGVEIEIAPLQPRLHHLHRHQL